MDVMASDFHYRSTKSTDKRFSYEYGVFVGLDEKKSSRLKDYHRVVIDAEYFSKKSIKKLKKQGHQTALDIRHGVCHAFQVFTAMPEARQALTVVFRTLEEWA